MTFNKEKFESIIETTIANEAVFEKAFTHRSYLNENPEINTSNERLEFLGDAVLQLLSSEYLFKMYPNSPEGDLTNFRSAVVCTKSLAHDARRLGYGELLFLSKGEETSGGRDREYILANTFEAVLGALYLDKGLDFCRQFTEKNLFYKVEQIVEDETYKDAKSKFQETAQEKTGITPYYRVLESWGADHEKTFRVAVYLDEEQYGVGEGKSKQKAEQSAAKNALDKLTSV
ncbi:ribonuclease III [Candidatus Nomurabacteria bacterium]|uniref:Ribonuclease 3 n=1 Tax=candidate division WWE3 bacterium TaxID=2053526 RepID=A0A955IW46_UNCKA|nr:ribonuclease III [candidate division WWE3 bacterium]MCB9823731.1 ribonuclease III [Candidatus Nomurabacteria bacterium]MCB9827190.1 ribonuclease III [Candidatus Nomurabacteria bacterium]MCB9827526.1 ribonuclease III [Candidatus Nomurabacteria bacterium]HXK52921.1 ribonuclease III [bacterium]